MDLFGEVEKLKLKFISASDALYRQDKLAEADLQQMLDVLDRFEELSLDEIRARLDPILRKTNK